MYCKSGLKVCNDGIISLGERKQDRVGSLYELATLPIHPESFPINILVPIDETPLTNIEKLDVIK